MHVFRRLALVLLCGGLTACAAGGSSASPSPAASVATAMPAVTASPSPPATIVPTASPSPSPTPAATPVPTSTPVPPTPRATTAPTPLPTFATGYLPWGDWATPLVTNLRVRTGHELDAPIKAVMQPGDQLFLVGSGAQTDVEATYYWYYVAYHAAVDPSGHVVAEGLGWLAGAEYDAAPYNLNWLINLQAVHNCPSPLPTIDDHMREHVTDWAMGACGIH